MMAGTWIGLAGLMLTGIGLWLAWANGQPGGICAVAGPPLCAVATETKAEPPQGASTSGSQALPSESEPDFAKSAAPTPAPAHPPVIDALPPSRNYPRVAIEPGRQMACPGFSFHVSGNGRVTEEEREEFKALLRAAICSDNPPPVEGCAPLGNPCWEITYSQ